MTISHLIATLRAAASPRSAWACGGLGRRGRAGHRMAGVGATSPGPLPTNLPPETLSLACAPSLAYEAPPAPLRITDSQESFVHRSFAPGDLIVINAGTDNGIDVG